MKFELDIIHWLQNLRNDFLNSLFEGITFFGEEVIIIVVLGVLYWCINKKTGERLGLTLFVSLMFNSIIKVIFMRPRPFIADSSIKPLRLETASGYSFPSGHTQSASTLFFGLYYFLKKKWLLIVAIIIALLVAVSRMYLGVHYMTDVLVGGLLGILFAYLGNRYLTDNINYKKIYTYILGILFIAFIVLMTINVIKAYGENIAFDSAQFYFDAESMSKMFGTIIGFIVGILYEKKYVNFTNHKNFKKNIVRFLLGIGIILLTRYALKWFFGLLVNPDNLVDGELFKSILALFFDLLRYFLMVFIGLGVYPKIFRKFNL